MENRKKLIERLPLMLIIAIGVCYLIMTWTMPFVSDDLVYSGAFAKKFGDMPLFGTVRKMRGHWLDINGRLFDMSNVFFLNVIPRWALSVLCGFMVAAFFWMMNLWCAGTGRRHVTARLALIALIAFTFCWWDGSMLFVVQFGYIWSAALLLYALYAYFNQHWWDRPRAVWLMGFLMLCAGCVHEAAGFAIVGGFIAYYWVNRRDWKSMDNYRRNVLWVFFAGACLTVSPGLIGRFISIHETVPDDSPFMLFFKSCFFCALLILIVAVEFIRDRRRLTQLARTPWIAFTVAAVLSSCVTALSGIIGRSGWFAQTFALVAICLWLKTFRPLRLNRAVAAALSAVFIVLTVAHYGTVLSVQLVMNSEISNMIDRFRANPSEYIFADYTRRADSPWYLLAKDFDVYDAAWSLQEPKSDGKPEDVYFPVVLPTELRTLDYASLELPYYGPGYIILENSYGFSGLSCVRQIGDRAYDVFAVELGGRSLLYARERYLPPLERRGLHPFGPATWPVALD